MHYLSNFKSFVSAELNLFQPVTLLIGKNGSGKTNAIEGIELLAHLAHGLPLFEVTDLGRGGRSYEVRGGLRDCARLGSEYFSLGLKAQVKFDGDLVPLFYELSIAPKPEPHVHTEKLVVGDRTLLSGTAASNRDLLHVTYDNFARGGSKPSTSISSDRSALSRYSSFTTIPDGANQERKLNALLVVSNISKYLKASFAFDPNSKTMRSYETIGQSVLLRDGSNLSAVLYSLKIGDDKNRESLARILNVISQLPEEPFTDFDFIITRQNDVLLGLKREDGTVIDARMLSDGTLRALAILAAIETAPSGSRVVIEEIDNGIHPSRVKLLVNALWGASSRRQLNVLATTHNPATLNSLTTEQMQAVTLCVHDREERASKLLRLDQLPRSEGIFANGQLGDLVARDALESYFEANFEGERRAAFSSWLKSVP